MARIGKVYKHGPRSGPSLVSLTLRKAQLAEILSSTEGVRTCVQDSRVENQTGSGPGP